MGNFEYVFDPAGQEAGEFTLNSCCHYWDTRYFRVGGRLLGEYFGGSNTFFIHPTALGSTNQVTDQTGIVQEDTLLIPGASRGSREEAAMTITSRGSS